MTSASRTGPTGLAQVRLLPTMARTRRFETIETMAVVLVISIAVGAALGYYRIALAKAALSEAASVINMLRYEVAAFRAREGRWPDTIDLPPIAAEGGIAAIEIEGGAITVTFAPRVESLAGRRLTYRPVESPAHPAATLHWTCGPSTVPTPGQAVGMDRTDVPAEYLPELCRQGAIR